MTESNEKTLTLDEWLAQFRTIEAMQKIGPCTFDLVEHNKSLETFVLKKLDLDELGSTENADIIKALFDFEVYALSAYPHVNVVRYASHFREDERRYLVLRETNLKVTLDKQSIPEAPLHRVKAVEFSIDICRAIESLHSQQIACGNLNPFNIAVNDSQALVFDLVSARGPQARERGYNKSDTTPVEFDPQVDLFSLGHILAFLVTGRHPDEERGEPSFDVAKEHFMSVIEDLTTEKLKDATLAKFRLYSLYNEITTNGQYYYVTKPDALQKLEEYEKALADSGSESDKKTLERIKNVRMQFHMQDNPTYQALSPKQQFEWNGIVAARHCIDNGQYAEALQLMMPFAGDGCPWAENNVGVLYECGCGVPKNERIAQAWYLRAAQQDNLTAQENLAVLLQKEGSKDEETALYWMSKAAKLRLDAGNDEKTYLVGLTYDWTESWNKHQGTARGHAEGRARYPHQGLDHQ